ncbi:glutamyl-tRNA reductase [Ectothiorhodospiraceae bacterium 2226]|nr:glutamyl-tRNA reductase [Ectothiorhodospiraceae bacterium 2226]
MALLTLGINHKTAPVEIRERLAFAPDALKDALRDLARRQPVEEAAILSTCNRTEVYCGLERPDARAVVEWLRGYHGLQRSDVEPYLYLHPNQDAVRHMLRVASGLDSLVLGEPQILGQIKGAYGTAAEAGTVGRRLGRLFQHSFAVAKRVRTDTAIGSSPVSVAFAAVSLARQIFGDLRANTALLIGAGETVELVARHLTENGIAKLYIANRTLAHAQLLAQQFQGEALPLDQVPERLAAADIVISSTASPLPILGKGAVESALRRRKHRPMFMVDIAVPRDIEAEVGELDDVYLYTVDDLKDLIDENLASRREAAAQAEEMIDVQVAHFMGWLRSLESVDVIREYREHSEAVRDKVVAEAQRQIARGVDPQLVVSAMGRLLTNKLMHQPSAQLRQAAYDDRRDVLDAARTLLLPKNDT